PGSMDQQRGSMDRRPGTMDQRRVSMNRRPGTMDPIADLTADGLFDPSDINLFVTAFLAGCP
ncbi:MAG: hypothetical protein K8E66_07650, partial [Phycisphaerales bacterium]|nr:hypothetical protein [Phycisphaerales bacterium]